MIKIYFKNVGQGDSILVEWINNSEYHYGIIDCNIYNGSNPLLDEIKLKNIKFFDFIIISHLHIDHYSGFADLFNYFLEENIKIGLLLHGIEHQFLKLFSEILTQNEQKATHKFFKSFDKIVCSKNVNQITQLNNNLKPIALSDNINLSFLSPIGNDYFKFSKEQANFENSKIGKLPDFNNLSTIVLIENNQEAILLTSDAVKKSFKRIIGKINKPIKFIQVPHHGSKNNLLPEFWKSLIIKENCPALFSVGEELKDKLPNVEVVRFFDESGFYINSTNFVFGLKEYFNGIKKAIKISNTLNMFSILKPNYGFENETESRFQGDKTYSLF